MTRAQHALLVFINATTLMEGHKHGIYANAKYLHFRFLFPLMPLDVGNSNMLAFSLYDYFQSNGVSV